ncbi:bifunctional biotin--[acetyl-CoA-carboxylase] ligase/biotin operon repressor BirA [Aliivibrio fischeri]|uniref:bifunctional biotin--[acetyl-CoA-carboxylase] ligase/biotin operon repressor BirA n=1 Tax=Aliivibrio fischeri TaxID=668 RepID=UPI000908238C|nr:bifunctional biotin--[acetyl-CoA-carboxylase] ligase/biotin operon repressor BirA [Aliivibrio fischeri]
MKEHTKKLEILRLLSDGHFHSGEELGEQLNISRAAISKHINVIQSWGLEIYKVKGKGYSLSTSIELLQQELVSHNKLPKPEVLGVVDSTNQYLLNNMTSLECGQSCIAEYQSAGRGRRGRSWVSPFGGNIYLSLYWRLDDGLAATMGLSLAVGIAVVEALENLGCSGLKLKWPNDIYWNNRKLGGVLIELSAQSGGAAHVVIGIGINVDLSERFTTEIDQPWVDLKTILGQNHIRNKLANALLVSLEETMKEFECFGLSRFVERWNKYDNFKGQEISLQLGNGTVTGVCNGIDAQGALLLINPDGLTAYNGGEISIKKQ